MPEYAYRLMPDNMNTETTTTESKVPYVAYKTFANFLTSLRQSGIPNRIDRSVMPGLAGSAQSYLLTALKFLGFINESGAPTAQLKDYVDHPTNEKAILAKAVKESYSFIFAEGFNIQAATVHELHDKLREKGLTGDTLRKALSFFVMLCDAAGVAISPHLKGSKTTATTSSNGSRRGRKKGGRSDDEFPDDAPLEVEKPKTLEEMLLAKFPEFDPNWDKEMQSKWFASFEQFMRSAKGVQNGQGKSGE